MAYRINLEVFEGPMDLLLYLIRKEEIEITDIPIARILEQYLAYIEIMRTLNLDVAGEFLVMASTLMAIKAKMLVPRHEEDEEELEDPRAELVENLLEYQRYKEAARELDERDMLERDVFVRPDSTEEYRKSLPPETAPGDVFDLLLAFRKVLEQLGTEAAIHEVELERVSLLDRLHELMDYFEQRSSCAFEDLFAGQATRIDVIVTFLAMLELMKLRIVRVIQEEPMGSILLMSDREALVQAREEGVEDQIDEGENEPA